MSAPPIHDRLLASNWQELEGTAFENFLAQVFDALGYAVEKKGAHGQKRRGDHGVDLLVSAGRSRFAVQAKGYPSGGQVGVDAVRDVNAGKQYFRCDASLVVTNSTFSSSAKDEARSFRCRLVDKHRMPYLIRGQVLALYPGEGAAQCPHCRRVVSFSARLCGQVAQCPSCSGKFTVPWVTFSPEERFQLGRRLVDQGDLEEGYALINQLCRTHPRFQSPLLFYAETFFEALRFPEALKFYRKAMQLGSCRPMVYANAAHAACQNREFGEARRLLDLAEKDVGRSNFTAAMWVSRGRAAAQLGDGEAALKHLRFAVNAGETDPARYENDPLLNPLRRARGFEQLMNRLRRRKRADSGASSKPARTSATASTGSSASRTLG
jgi:hypothetical protein